MNAPFPYPCLTSNFACAEYFRIMNIHVPAGVGAPQLDTQLQIKGTCDVADALRTSHSSDVKEAFSDI